MKNCLFEETIAPDASKERLDVTVARVGSLTRSFAIQIIKDGLTKVDSNTVRRPSYIVRPGSRIEVEIAEPVTSGVATPSLVLEPKYYDDHIAVYDKPAGIVTHPGAGNKCGTLSDALTARFPKAVYAGEPERPGIVHRLDKDTSGLIATALTAESHRLMSAMVQDRRMNRIYTALVCGHPKSDVGVIEAPIGRSRKRPAKQAVVEGGKPAKTRYRTVRKIGDFALLEVELETGRMHQIRVHMSAVGHPIAGDPLYGSRNINGLERQFLHAGSLDFPHPVSGKRQTFKSPLPEDLKGFLETIDAKA